MESRAELLDFDRNSLDTHLKILPDTNDDFNKLTGSAGGLDELLSITVKPEPGMCIKCYKNRKEKFFINLCHTDAIQSPEDITEEELLAILESCTPSSFRVPMSISEPRFTTDKSGNEVEVCDIAVNPNFYQKCLKTQVFRDFLIVLMLEAIEDKYGIHIDQSDWIILKNRKFIGNLVSHRLQNRKLKNVHDSITNRTEKVLIEEVSPMQAEIRMPIHKFYVRNNESFENCQVFAEFYLPQCISGNDVTVHVGEDRLVLKSVKHGYYFDKFFEYDIDQTKVRANFDYTTKILTLKMPVSHNNEKRKKSYK